MKQTRVKIKQQRIMKYFIESAKEIIEKEGIEAVTIRKTADLAGYTSATLYNYFDNLPHLIFLATKVQLEEYNTDLYKYIARCENSIEIYISVCKCFCIHAYKKPEIFELIFFTQEKNKYEEYTKQYYELYPSKEENIPNFLNKIYHLNNIYSRSFIMLQYCINDGYITEENATDFNDITLRFTKTIIQDVKNIILEKEKAIELTMKYYYQLFGFYLEPEYKPLLEKYYKEIMKDK